MSTVQNSPNIDLTVLASEYKNASDNINTNSTIDNHGQQTVIDEQHGNVSAIQQIEKESQLEQPLTAEQLDKVAQQLQDFVGDLNRNIEFSVDEDSGRDVIKVVDKDSGDILKQYPSEEVLTLVSKLSDMIGGFVDTQV